MANNFRIMFHKNRENLYLKLVGDFDGTSAYELIETIKRNCNGSSSIPTILKTFTRLDVISF